MSDEVEKVSGFAKNIYSIIILVAFVVGLGITWGTFTSNVDGTKKLGGFVPLPAILA